MGIRETSSGDIQSRRAKRVLPTTNLCEKVGISIKKESARRKAKYECHDAIKMENKFDTPNTCSAQNCSLVGRSLVVCTELLIIGELHVVVHNLAERFGSDGKTGTGGSSY